MTKESVPMKEYMEKKISAFLKEVNDPQGYLARLAGADKEIRRMWRDECDKDNSKWRRISKNQDVFDLIDFFDGTVRFVEENVRFGDGHIEDGYHMALAEYRALQGLRKMAQFIDPSPFNRTEFTMLTEREVDELFDRMKDIAKRMNEQNTRRMMQD